MNTLWIFGDSFSSEFDYNNLHENHISYMNIIGVNHIPVWGTVLAEKLGYEIKNLAKGGSSNYQIFQDYCDSCHLIQPNDKGKHVLFGGFPKDCDKKQIIWELVAKREPQITWAYTKNNTLKKENFDQSDAYCCVLGYMKQENIW